MRWQGDRWNRLAVLLTSSPLVAQRLNIRSYTPEDGLAGAPVWQIFQDERGVMWFATDGGVSAYDGVSFRNISVENGLPSANTGLIARARDGSLWFGTSTDLVRYDGTSLQKLTAGHGRWAGTLDKHGNAWFGDSAGIYVFDGTSAKLFRELAEGEVYSVTPIGDSVWVGRRDKGAVEMLVDGTKLTGIRRYRPEDGMAHPTVRALARDHQGRMYFGTRGKGISRFDGKSWATFDTRHGLPSNDIYALLITRKGELVAGTFDNGLAICDLPDFHRCRAINIDNGLHARSVFSLFEDREGNVWIGLVNGVSKLMSLHAESFTEQEGLPSDHVYSILPEANGEIWVGTLGGLAHRRAGAPWERYGERNGLPTAEVRDVLRDATGRLWIATSRGLCTTEDVSRGFRCFTRADGLNSDYVIELALSRTGDLLVGTSGGDLMLVTYSPSRPLAVQRFVVGSGVNSVVEDGSGRLWVASNDAGVWRFERNGTGRQFLKADGLASDGVLALHIDPRGGLWAGLHGGGLCYLAPGADRFRSIGTSHGLNATTVSAITEDENGRLWLGTNRGLFQIDPRGAYSTADAFVLQWLDEHDGLISRQVNSSNALRIDPDKRIWAGFLRGLSVYDPRLRTPNPIAPEVRIVIAAIDGQTLHAPFSTVDGGGTLRWPISAPLRLDHRQNNLRFEFRGLSFRDEGDVRFRYRLEGFDRDWSPVTNQPFKEYTNLDHGNYTFRVMASNGDNVWSKTPAAFAFAIHPPWWRMNSFRLAGLLLLLFLLLTAHKLRVRGVERHNRQLETTVMLRTEELRGVAVDLEDKVEKRTAELAHQALHDVLTGLPNRNLLMDRLEQAIARGKRRPDLFAVLFLDLDRFKVVNDSLGHFAGDQLLIGTARRLEASIRPGDTVSRLGGDEFVIFLDEISDREDALQIVERIQHRLAEPFLVGGNEIYVTASIGVTISSIGYERAESILRDSDIAMYRAKLQGRARYETFDEWMRADARAVMELETDLRRAVERNEFSVLYQPIVALDSGRLTGFEALVRWEHPTRGRTLPAEFLPLAEETGLIVAIDRIVLRTACEQLRRWSDAFPSRPLSVSVNLSNRQFRRDDLVDAVSESLARSNIGENGLGLEITEGTIMEGADRAVDILTDLRKRGVQWSIDDFGTGYSSLSYLHQFPVDILKIDQSFVRRMGPQGENTEIIRTIITLARSLGMRVVAEGVETAEQLAILQARGCDFGQGYYFSHPIDHESATSLIVQNPVWGAASVPS